MGGRKAWGRASTNADRPETGMSRSARWNGSAVTHRDRHTGAVRRNASDMRSSFRITVRQKSPGQGRDHRVNGAWPHDKHLKDAGLGSVGWPRVIGARPEPRAEAEVRRGRGNRGGLADNATIAPIRLDPAHTTELWCQLPGSWHLNRRTDPFDVRSTRSSDADGDFGLRSTSKPDRYLTSTAGQG